MLSVATSGWLMARSLAALEGSGASPLYAEMKRAACRFYLERIVPEALGLTAGATGGAELLYAPSPDAFAA